MSYADQLRAIIYQIHNTDDGIIKDGIRKQMSAIIQAARAADVRAKQVMWSPRPQPRTLKEQRGRRLQHNNFC